MTPSWEVQVRLRLGALDLDVELAGGSAPVALIGPNGSGKTTLLRTIAGAHRPDEGRVRLGERVVFDSGASIDLAPEARRVGYVPQGYGLFPHLSVLENVAFGVRARRRARDGEPGESGADPRETARAILERVGCAHLAGRSPRGLSGGEQQRVALARALTVRPDILLLDEPLAALDARARRQIRTYVVEHLAARPAPAIVVSHDARDVSALGATVHVLEAGRVVQSGTPAELASRPATEFVEAFFEG